MYSSSFIFFSLFFSLSNIGEGLFARVCVYICVFSEAPLYAERAITLDKRSNSCASSSAARCVRVCIIIEVAARATRTSVTYDDVAIYTGVYIREGLRCVYMRRDMTVMCGLRVAEILTALLYTALFIEFRTLFFFVSFSFIITDD